MRRLLVLLALAGWSAGCGPGGEAVSAQLAHTRAVSQLERDFLVRELDNWLSQKCEGRKEKGVARDEHDHRLSNHDGTFISELRPMASSFGGALGVETALVGGAVDEWADVHVVTARVCDRRIRTARDLPHVLAGFAGPVPLLPVELTAEVVQDAGVAGGWARRVRSPTSALCTTTTCIILASTTRRSRACSLRAVKTRW